MSITDFCIKKPIYSIIISIVLTVVGTLCFFDLETSQYPSVKASTLKITYHSHGMNAKELEQSITAPVEMALSNIDQLDYINSVSAFGWSDVYLTFQSGYDVAEAIPNIRAKLSAIESKLPKNLIGPTIRKIDPNQQPSLYMSINNNQLNFAGVYAYYLKNILPSFQNLPGIGEMKPMGPFQEAMRLKFDPIALNAYGLSLPEAYGYALQQTSAGPSGLAANKQSSLPISLTKSLNSPKDFEQLPITPLPDSPILNDVAQARFDKEWVGVEAKLNGQSSIAVGVIPTSDANAITVAKQIKATINKIRNTLDPNFDISIFFDKSIALQESLNMVYRVIVETIILVFITMVLTLGSVRMVMIPLVVIPISMLTSFLFMKHLNFSLNQITLLAIVLSIGMIVDDAIVVAENVHRHMEQGKGRLEAALVGAREIVRPVMLITMTLAVIFAPLGFIEGMTGRLFREFGYTIAISVIISGVAALTLSPMMCAYVLPKQAANHPIAAKISDIVHALTLKYHQALIKVMHYKKSMFLSCVFIALLSAVGYMVFPKILVPIEESGAIYTFIFGPPSVNSKYIETKISEINKVLSQQPETKDIFTLAGAPISSQGIILQTLEDLSTRKRSTAEIIRSMAEPISKIPSVKIFQVNPFFTPGSASFFPVSFVVKSNMPYQAFENKLNQMMKEVKENPAFLFAMHNQLPVQPQLELTINHKLASQLGVSTESINQLLGLTFGNLRLKTFIKDDQQLYIIPEISDTIDTTTALNQLSIRASSGDLVPLSVLVTPQLNNTPPTIFRFQGMQAAQIDAFVFPGYSQTKAHQFLKETMIKYFPTGTQDDYTGQSRSFNQIQGQSQSLIIYALLFIYTCLALYYESWKDPLVILCTAPLSLFGAIICLLLAQGTINIYTNISILTLFALITKHGILIVEFTKQLVKSEKYDHNMAVVKAATVRFRPIILTSFSMIFGTLPLMWTSGYGGQCRFEVAVVICGGMTIGTLLTLFVLPAFYSVIHQQNNPEQKKWWQLSKPTT
jgi:multidrug efflux pump